MNWRWVACVLGSSPDGQILLFRERLEGSPAPGALSGQCWYSPGSKGRTALGRNTQCIILHLTFFFCLMSANYILKSKSMFWGERPTNGCLTWEENTTKRLPETSGSFAQGRNRWGERLWSRRARLRNGCFRTLSHESGWSNIPRGIYDKKPQEASWEFPGVCHRSLLCVTGVSMWTTVIHLHLLTVSWVTG